MKQKANVYHRYNPYQITILWMVGLTLALIINTNLFAKPADDIFTKGWLDYNEGRYEQALTIWLPLAEAGDANTQINLGVMYDKGLGVTRDPAEAVHWYQSAAMQGSSAGQFNLALKYAQGEGVEQDLEQAAYWYEKAANNEVALAQFNLGMLYAQGKGVQQNMSSAYHWLDKAAELELADAQYNLAALYIAEDTEDYRKLALNLYYRAGLNYLKKGDERAALFSANSISKLAPGHEYAELIKKNSSLKQEETVQNDSLDLAPLNGFSAGTAWPVAKGYAVTNNHVVADITQVALVNTYGDQISATVVLRDEANDIALLKVEDHNLLPPALPLANNTVRLGTDVFTIGYPRIDIMGRTPKLTDGIISSVNGLADDPKTLQISVPIQPGNSGGPLMNMKGEVVGVVASMLGATDSASGTTQLLSNVNYAIKIDVVRALLPLLPHYESDLVELQVGKRGLADLADEIQNSVMIVMAW